MPIEKIIANLPQKCISLANNANSVAQKVIPEINESSLKLHSKTARAYALAQIKKSPLAALNEITQYGKEIRIKKGITLDRNPLWDCDIPYQKNNYYRVIGEKGFKDIESSGLIRPKMDTKQGYKLVYFEKGKANSIYARHGGAKYILEVPQCPNMIISEEAYPHINPTKATDIPFRIWASEDGKTYSIVKDTINDVITKNPSFRFKI